MARRLDRSAIWFVTVGLVLVSCSSRPGADDQASAIFDRIGADDPFCTAAVLEEDRLVWADAFGSDSDGPVDTGTEVDIASVSKQFTGVAIELLIDRGELSGSEQVAELVPASTPGTADITIDELLTHISGIADYGDLLPQELDEPATQEQAVAAIAKSASTGSRGTFEYSNSNYVLLADVVERVSGEPLPDFLDAEVFGPLDLDMAVDPQGPWTQIGDGSIWTTPTELVTWSTQYWDQTLDGPDLRTVMFDPEVDSAEDGDPGDEQYGSGVSRTTTDDGADLLFHDGSWGDYETDWALLPDEHLAAAVTCSAEADLSSDTPAMDLLEIWRA